MAGSGNDEHIAAPRKKIHETADKDHLGCVSRHETDYASETWPDCNYRKNAETYSKAK